MTVTTVASILGVVSVLATLATAVAFGVLHRSLRRLPQHDDATRLVSIAAELSEISTRVGDRTRRRRA